MVAGQIPRELAKAFTNEKYSNPNAGKEPKQSVVDGWYMLAL